MKRLVEKLSLAFIVTLTVSTVIPIPVILSSVQAEESERGRVDEVIVSSRKKQESIQEVPISVLTFDAEKLEQQNIFDLADLSAKLPNVFVGAGGGMGSNNGSFFIRGLGSDRNAINQESAVALYIDDSYYGRSDGALLGIMDVQSIEVLRGPQGTLFGRNATAGAIRYITEKPDEEFESKFQLTLGTDNRQDLKASVNLPLGDSDTAALRLTGATINQDGFQTNAIGQDLGNKETQAFRGYLRVLPSDDLEILASLDFSITNTNGSAYSLLGLVNNPDLALGPNVVGNGVAQAIAAGFDVMSDPIGSTTRSGSTLHAYNDTKGVGAGISFNWSLDNDMSLKWANTYRSIDIKSQFDFDATRAELFENQRVDRDSKMWSTELQLSGFAFDENMNWITGIFYYEETSNDFRDSVQVWSPRGPAFYGQAVSGGALTTTRTTLPHELNSSAIFGQASWDLTDSFAVTAGLRYTKDEKRILAQEYDNAGNSIQYDSLDLTGATGDLIVERSDSWGAASGRVSLEYQATGNTFVFASYARGFRAGGINDRIRNDLDPPTYGITSFDEEILDTFELGMRSDLANNTLRLNLTLFTNDFKDLQISAQRTRFDNGRSRTVVDNVGAATSSGLEAEIIWAVSENLKLDANIGFMNSEIEEGGANIDPGVSMPNSPDFQYNIGAEYYFNLADSGDITVRLDYAGIDDFFSNVARNQLYTLDGYETLDINVAYTPASGSWTLSFYGKNITGEDYFTQALSFLNDAPFGLVAGTPARGSEFGIKFDYSYLGF